MWQSIMRIFAGASGLSRLIDDYRTDRRPTDAAHTQQTVMIGAVRYRRCVVVDIDARGLYIWVRVPRSNHPAVLIPWSSVTRAGRARIYQRNAMALSIGSPEAARVAVPSDLFDQVRPFLAQAAATATGSAD